MDAVHASSDVARDFMDDEASEGGKGLCFAPRSIQKGRSHHIHALDVSDVRLAEIPGVARIGDGCHGAQGVARTDGAGRVEVVAVETLGNAQGGWRDASRPARLVGVIELPGHGIQHAGQAVLGHASSKQRIRGQSAKGIISNLGIRRRGTELHQIQIGVGVEGRGVEQYQPDVDAQFRLLAMVSIGWVFFFLCSPTSILCEGMRCQEETYHAVAVGRYAVQQDHAPELFQASNMVAARGTLLEKGFQMGHSSLDVVLSLSECKSESGYESG